MNGDREVYPVINVTWDDAKAYTIWLSDQTGKTYRRPSEAEWEYAAREGHHRKQDNYSWGTEIGISKANCSICGSNWDDSKTAPVGSFNANLLGLFDMHGNLREWVADCYVDSYLDAPLDGKAREKEGCPERVIRGGAWNTGERILKSTNRAKDKPENKNNNSCFRIAQTVSTM